MFRKIIVGCCILALSTACDETSTTPEQPPPLPADTVDQVGLPAAYTAPPFRQFYVFDRADNRQVRVVYANPVADAGQPFAHGSILVMETYSAQRDAQGVPILDGNGRYVRGALSGIFVMRKEKWFGRRYGVNQNGEWEYASYGPTGTARVFGDSAEVACAVCHLDAGQSRDWVYRANIRFAGASGAIPQPRPGQLPNQPFIDNYTFVPDTIRVPVGTTVTWTNDDQVEHTVTANDRAFSRLLPHGARFSPTFSAAGTFDYFCALHDRMRGTVVVQP